MIEVDFSAATPTVDIRAARSGVRIDVSKSGPAGPRGEQGPGVGETVASIASERGWRALRVALDAGTARVVAMGDSKTEGAGVSLTADRWLDVLMGRLRARYAPTGDQGLGYLPAYYATFWGFPSAPTTSGSAVTVGNGGGLGNRSRHLAAGGSVTWTVPAWTSGVPLLVHWTQHPGLGDLEVVTGGTVRATIATAGSTIASKVTPVTIPAGATSITIRHKSGTGTGNAARVEGIVHRTATTGVVIYDGARSGAKVVDYSEGLGSSGTPDSEDYHWQAVAAVAPHAVILAFGANDQSDPPGGRTASQWANDLRVAVAKAKAAAPGAGIVLLHGAQRTEEAGDPSRILAFEAAARDAIGADPDVSILYESQLWAPVVGEDYADGDGIWLSDTVHTNVTANRAIARMLFASITAAEGGGGGVGAGSPQTLSLTGNNLTLSGGGGTVTLPSGGGGVSEWGDIIGKPATFPPDLTGVTAATVGAYATRNVRAYGATGNGSDDDTAAIQAAIDAGGVVTFDPGTYRITAPLVLKAGTILQGCHAPSYSPDVNPTTAGSKIIAANGYTGTSMVSVAGTASGCAIYNMLICGNNQGSDVHGIGLPQTIPGELSLRMRDVQIAGMSGAGMEGSLHVGQLYGVHIGRCGSNAVRVTGSNRWVDVKVVGMFAYFNARSAIYFAGGHTGAVEFSMCRFERSGQTYGDPDNVGGGFNADEAGVRIRRGQFLSFLSCTTDANTGAGFHIDGQTNAASQLTDISFTQCRASRDGGGDQSGTFEGAGFLVSAFSEVEANRPRRMFFTACTTSTGRSNDGDGSGPVSPRRGLSNVGAWQTVWHGRIPQVAGGGTAFHLSGDNYGTSIFYAADDGRTFVWRPHAGAATQLGS